MSERPEITRRDLPPELVALARGVASQYFLPGESDDEILQVAMIGAWNAVRAYEPGHDTTLAQFAKVTIRRSVISAIKAANRHRRHFERDALLPEYVDGERVTIETAAVDHRADVPAEAAARIELARVRGLLPLLSERERSVLVGTAVGLSYAEMSDRATFDKAAVSSVDNAYVRARRKLAA